MKIIIIIPTYNERDNIGQLIEELQRHFQNIPHEAHILVVDDTSPDGTAEAVEETQKRYTNVHLLTGPKQGLGAAYIRGMRYALDELGADVIFEMDADFSHKPEDIFPMIAALEKGADFVIGSRYISGGKIPKKWGIFRKAISRFGNLVARYIGGLYKTNDCTAGFRAIRSWVLKKSELSKVRANGYAFQIELLHRAISNGAKVQEIPVEFVDRTYGKSKLGISDIAEFMVSAGLIRFNASKPFIKFVAVGTSGLLMNLASFILFLSLGMSKYPASLLAIEFSIMWNFLLNNHWTFGSRKVDRRISDRVLKFNLVSLLALSVSFSTFLALNDIFPHAQPYVCQMISVLPATIVNYHLNSYWTFREVKKTTASEQVVKP